MSIEHDIIVQNRNTIIDWNRTNSGGGESLFTNRLRDDGLTDGQIITVLKNLDNICQHCWDTTYPCSCWNDE